MRRIKSACGRAMAGVLVLFTVLAGGAGEACADDLVGNINVEPTYHNDATVTLVDVDGRKAQRFTTGANAAGYTLSSVVAYIMYLPNIANQGRPRLKIYSSTTATADAAKRPDTLLYTLTTPSTLSVEPTYGTYSLTALNTFTAANATLDPNKDYFVVFENTGTVKATSTDNDNGIFSDYVLPFVFNGNEDSGKAAGWSLADDYCTGTLTTWSRCSSATKPLRLKIEGTTRTVDDLPPSLKAATVDGSSLVLTYNEALAEASVPAASAYSVSVASGAGTAPSSVDVSGRTVTLTLGTAVTAGQTVTVTYTVPSNPVQDAAGNAALPFSLQPVENQSATVPNAPTNLTATANGSTQIDLSWTAPEDNGGSPITGYKIQVRYYEGDNWEDLVSDTVSTDIMYSHMDLDTGTTYYYRVFAINVVDPSEKASNVVTETTPTGDGRPSAPLNLRAEAVGETQIELYWDAQGSPGTSAVIGYKIEMCIVDGYICAADGGNNWTDLVASQTATTYEHMDLVSSTTYAYRVYAINSVGTSDRNLEPNDFSVNARTYPLDFKNEPRNLRAVPGDGKMTLIWGLPAIPEEAILTAYEWQAQRKVDNGITEAADGEWRTTGAFDCNPCQRTMRELTNGVTYTFFVRAVIAYKAEHGAQGAYSLPAQIEATPGQPPPPPPPEDETPEDKMPDDEMIENTPPIVAIPLMDQTETAGVAFTYVIPEDAFTDADGDPLAYAVVTSNGGGLPGWLTFTAATRTFTGTPDPGDGGTMNLTVTASDGIAAVSDDFALTVLVAPPVAIRSWTARFGRTVGTHVTDAIGQRLREAVDSHVTVGNYRLPLGQQPGDAAEPEARQPRLTLGSAGTRQDVGAAGTGQPRSGSVAPDPWTDQPEADPRMDRSQTLRLRDLLMGSSFRLRLGGDDAQPGAMNLTAWGRMAGTQFDGRDQAVAVDGDVLTGTLGVDGAWDRWLAGVAVSHSQGDGSFTLPEIDGTGELENSLTSLHPYLRYAVNDRLDVWGVLGYGWGNLTLKPVTGGTLETDTNLMMGSFGGRGILRPALENGGFELATRTDAMFTRLSSEAVAGLAAVDADAHRLRVVLEGSRPVTWPEGQSVTPSMEVGVRHDWGDAETGFGLELGGRVQYADPGHGLTIEAAVRGLLAHEDSDYEEWGASGTIRIDPGPMGPGLALTLSPTWGAASSGVDGLWSRQTTAGLAPQGGTQAQAGRLNAQVGYGLWLPSTGGLVTPFTGVSVTDGDGWQTRAGLVFDRPGTWGGGLRVELAGESNATAVGQAEQTIGLQLQVTFGSGRRGVQSDNGRRAAQGKNGRGAKARSTPVPSPTTPDGVVTGPRTPTPTRADKGRHRAAVRHHATAQSPAWLRKTPPVSALDLSGGRQYVVQLGTFSNHADAIKARTELAVDLSDILHHTNRPLTIVASKRDGLRRVVFAQVFPTPEVAAALCAAIKTRGPACSVTAVWPAPGSDPHGRRVAEAHGGR